MPNASVRQGFSQAYRSPSSTVRYAKPSTKTIQKNVMLKFAYGLCVPSQPLAMHNSSAATPAICSGSSAAAGTLPRQRGGGDAVAAARGAEPKYASTTNDAINAPAAPHAYSQNGTGRLNARPNECADAATGLQA